MFSYRSFIVTCFTLDLEETIAENLRSWVRQLFLSYDTNYKVHKRKNDKTDFIKIKNPSSKHAVRKKRQTIDKEKIFTKHVSGFIARKY